MDCSGLVAPAGEKTVLFVGEEHSTPALEELVQLLETFRPEAITLERGATPLDLKELQPYREGIDAATLDGKNCAEAYNSFFTAHGECPSPLRIACLYAASNKIPLYLIDWQPHPPQENGDVFAGKAAEVPCSEHLSSWEEALASVGEHAAEDAMREVEGSDTASMFLDGTAMYFSHHIGNEADAEAETDAYAYSISPLGNKLRNEYMAAALDSIGAERILHVGGLTHLVPETGLAEMGYTTGSSVTPLQELVHSQHRYCVNLDSTSVDWPGYEEVLPYGKIVRVERSAEPTYLGKSVPFPGAEAER